MALGLIIILPATVSQHHMFRDISVCLKIPNHFTRVLGRESCLVAEMPLELAVSRIWSVSVVNLGLWSGKHEGCVFLFQ